MQTTVHVYKVEFTKTSHSQVSGQGFGSSFDLEDSEPVKVTYSCSVNWGKSIDGFLQGETGFTLADESLTKLAKNLSRHYAMVPHSLSEPVKLVYEPDAEGVEMASRLGDGFGIARTLNYYERDLFITTFQEANRLAAAAKS